MQSISFDYLLYVLFSVLYTHKSGKLGKYSCPTMLASSILYISTADVSVEFGIDYLAAVF